MEVDCRVIQFRGYCFIAKDIEYVVDCCYFFSLAIVNHCLCVSFILQTPNSYQDTEINPYKIKDIGKATSSSSSKFFINQLPGQNPLLPG